MLCTAETKIKLANENRVSFCCVVQFANYVGSTYFTALWCQNILLLIKLTNNLYQRWNVLVTETGLHRGLVSIYHA